MEAAEEEYSDDELAEKDRLRGGQAKIAGVGEIEGEGEESRVKGGDAEPLLSVAMTGPGELMASEGGCGREILEPSMVMAGIYNPRHANAY